MLNKILICSAILLISGCSDSIDCNNKNIIDKIKSDIISKLSSMDNPSWDNINKNTDFEISGTQSGKTDDDGVQVCNFNFTIYPPIAEPVTISNTTPISVKIRKNKDKLEFSETSLSSELESMFMNQTIKIEETKKPSRLQSELIKKQKVEEKK